MIATPATTLTQFGKYLLDGEIATGGMSKVFRARLRGPGGFEKRLVVKQILPQLAQDPNFIRMFVQEANTLVQMSHPNIVPVYELGVVDGVYFLAMELVEGATLAEILRDGPLPEALVAHLGIQISDALHYAHNRFSVIHRDVTPRNLVVDDAGHARLLDFGIAAPADEAGRFGSLGYMSPEQARGLPLGPESDLFSLGTLLFEALSGTPAYLRDSPEATRSALLEREPPQLRPEHASASMRQWVTRCLAHDREQRPRAAAEVAKGLRALLAASHPAGVAEELGRRARASRMRSEERARVELPSTSDEIAATPQTRGHNRTLATSPILDQILQQTERIDRGASGALPLESTALEAPAPAPIAASSAHAVAAVAEGARADNTVASSAVDTRTARSRSWAAWLGVAIVLLIGVWALAPLRTDGDPKPRTSLEPAIAATPSTTKPPPAAPASTTPTAADAGVSPSVRNDAGASVVAASARGWLVINALPWADVRLDGRALGSTPLRRVAVDAGKHTLELACPPLGRDARVPLQVKANETLRLVIDLNQVPPRIHKK